MKRLLLVGGGHSHVEVLRRFGRRPAAGVEITLLDPSPWAAYSGMLPGLIAGHYRFQDCHIDLARVARFARATFIRSRAHEVDAARQEVRLTDGSSLGYDVLSLDVGAGPAPPPAGANLEAVIAVKPAATLLQAWNAIVARARDVRKIAVIGGGAAGLEMLLAMQHRLADTGAVRFALVSGHPLLAGHNARVRRRLLSVLNARGVAVHAGHQVIRFDAGTAVCDSGLRVAADAYVWATGASAPTLPVGDLARDEAGFFLVNRHLQSVSHPRVFAAGDCAAIANCPRPKSGVYAVREGPPLAANLRHALAGETLAEYRPQRSALALISCGDRRAVASYGPLALAGAWVWWWKDRIDRGFVARYGRLECSS